MTTTVFDRTRMYGVLHRLDGEPVERQVRILKVGIGVPAGPDVHVWINSQGQWCVETSVYEGKKRTAEVQRFDERGDAEARYREVRKSAHKREYPRKNPYFTFLRLAGDGSFVHDFDAIEQHGPAPTEIDVVFLTENCFEYAFQWWTAARLNCEGDGLNARRQLDLAKTKEEQELAQEAVRRGERFLPIVGGCFTAGCPYARGDKPVCKPHGRLFFQLLNSPRIGGTCQLDTTGYRSITQLYSCIRQIRSVTGRGDPERGTIAGIPLKMLVRPYKTQHNGQLSVQYGVSLEFRARTALDVARLLNEHASRYLEAAGLMPVPAENQNNAAVFEPDIPATPVDAGAVEEPVADALLGDAEAKAMAAEFYGDFPETSDAWSDPDGPDRPEPGMPQRR